MPRRRPKDEPLRSATGVALTRVVSFRFALDPTRDQERALLAHAGAARFTFNHHIGRVKANLDQRAAERSYDIPDAALTPSLSWSKFSCINEFNQFKNGQLPASPVNADGTVGLSWRNEVSAYVFEIASVNAAQALANFSESRKGLRKGKAAGFPKFKNRHKTAPSFRLRNHAAPGAVQQIRVTGPKTVRVPTLGDLRVHGCTRRIRRMLHAGRLHLYSAAFRCERGRWWMSLTGLAAPFHHQRRAPTGRHPVPAGLDRGAKTLAVVADADSTLLARVEGVKPLTAALDKSHDRLRRASRAYARTKPGSESRRKAKARLTKIHARIAHQRAAGLHLLSNWCATNLSTLVVEDLNVAGMSQFRTLARAVSDAGMGELGRQLTYKASWYGLELIEADRWYASSKTCHHCQSVNAGLTLDDRNWTCGACDTIHDRDVNAAINLARWPNQQAIANSPLPAVA
jgi:putative transposase